MITVSEAKQLVLSHLPQRAVQKVTLDDALGRIAAADILSPLALPPFIQSSVDGYAIRLEDIGTPLPVSGEVAAGAVSQKLQPGSAMRVLTGAMVPSGADTVVMQEHVRRSPAGIYFDPIPTQLGLNVRHIGSHIEKGELALRAGDKIAPAVVGHLAGLGVSEVEVYMLPKVALLTTGNEVVAPGAARGPCEIYDSNQALLRAALRERGIIPVLTGHVRDDQAQLLKEMESALSQCDMLLVSGGMSVGDYDYVPPLLEKLGVTKVFHCVKQKPGKPLYFGTRGRQLIFGLPGNPASSLTCFYEYVSLALGPSVRVRLPLRNTYRKASGLVHFLKGFADSAGVEVLMGQESYKLHSFTQANCLVEIPEERELVNQGEMVDVRVL